ncbi:hypothetical protein G4B88_019900, partial [Cannabis sativa]
FPVCIDIKVKLTPLSLSNSTKFYFFRSRFLNGEGKWGVEEISTDVVEHRRGKYSRIQDAEDPQLSLFDKPLPCCGCGIGWFSFLLGFVFPLMWYYATFLYFRNYYQRDPRERAGLAASAIAVSFGMYNRSDNCGTSCCFVILVNMMPLGSYIHISASSMKLKTNGKIKIKLSLLTYITRPKKIILLSQFQ